MMERRQAFLPAIRHSVEAEDRRLIFK